MEEDINIKNLFAYFEYKHLPEKLQTVSCRFHLLAEAMLGDEDMPKNNSQFIYGLQKLLEAKDCFVRAALDKEEQIGG